jgi:hypothetical protein
MANWWIVSPSQGVLNANTDIHHSMGTNLSGDVLKQQIICSESLAERAMIRFKEAY